MIIDLNIPQQVMIATALETRLTRISEMIQLFQRDLKTSTDPEREEIMIERYVQEEAEVNQLLQTIKAMY